MIRGLKFALAGGILAGCLGIGSVNAEAATGKTGLPTMDEILIVCKAGGKASLTFIQSEQNRTKDPTFSDLSSSQLEDMILRDNALVYSAHSQALVELGYMTTTPQDRQVVESLCEFFRSGQNQGIAFFTSQLGTALAKR